MALYTTHLVRHFPLSCQVSGLLQLYVRGSSAGAGLRILALWPSTMVAMMPIQLKLFLCCFSCFIGGGVGNAYPRDPRSYWQRCLSRFS